MEFPAVRLAGPEVQSELDSLLASGVETILLADCRGAETLQRCDMALSVAEARAGRESGGVRIIAGIESAAGVMQVAALGGKSARLAGLAWNRRAFLADMPSAPDAAIADHAQRQILIAARAFDLPAYVLLQAE